MAAREQHPAPETVQDWQHLHQPSRSQCPGSCLPYHQPAPTWIHPLLSLCQHCQTRETHRDPQAHCINCVPWLAQTQMCSKPGYTNAMPHAILETPLMTRAWPTLLSGTWSPGPHRQKPLLPPVLVPSHATNSRTARARSI